ncbi:nicotinamide mononucleotide transporter family protein [Nocardioides daphniae]|uniref:Membrane protein n=1 Tax=Nocardioides daphniae TaxID=402297 RepID=A0A4P7UCW3_9ACTN|nr:nicotinamide mononucleotide transporter family protein [Nocardioides daphniae]QCC77138.1 nicotinamide riboside transporter PnuC [Nocardioides daphniae]GGD19965.1 membrane protein [Nocardioides daphniae]
MSILQWLFDGTIPVGNSFLSVPEVLGNVFGLASAILGMKRWMLAWPIGLVGNVLLFFVFTTGSIAEIGDQPLWGQAGRQIFFAAVSLYGWWRWSQEKRNGAGAGAAAITPRWATWSERGVLVGAGLVVWLATWAVFTQIGSWNPPTEAWIVAGSMLATWGMARGWVEFWLVWIAVDVVGVWSLATSHYPAHATIGMYLFYAFFVVLGFFTWWRAASEDDGEPPLVHDWGTGEAAETGQVTA